MRVSQGARKACENRIKCFIRNYTDSFLLHFISTNKIITQRKPLNNIDIYNRLGNSRDRFSSKKYKVLQIKLK